MTIGADSEARLETDLLAERLHGCAGNYLGVDTDDVLATAHRDGYVRALSTSEIGTTADPKIRTLELPYGCSARAGNYGDIPGLSIEIHEAYAAEVDDETARRDALALLATVFEETTGERTR